MVHDSNDRFGMPDAAFRAAAEAQGDTGVFRVGTYIPTRGEVATMPRNTLASILTDWIWESPTELIPSKAQISAVQEILEARQDAVDFESVIDMCRDYVRSA